MLDVSGGSATVSGPHVSLLRSPAALLGAALVLAWAPVTNLPLPHLMWWSAHAHPQPLSATEEASPVAARLARRFNPAMALSDGSIWPIPVSYAWRDGADLVAQVMNPAGKVAERYVAVPNADLARRPWADLPVHDAGGRPVRYSIDAPGDDRPSAGDARGGDRRSSWRDRWQALVGGDPLRPLQAGDAAAFRPTQYAHLFWFNRAEGLLGIQYWFYYPFNEWINKHEGDWEHVNVILQGPPRLDAGTEAQFRPIGYQFAFHGWRFETDQVVRVGGASTGEDHVVVFVGGRSHLLWWRGKTSGGSYPLPALFPGAGSGPVKPDEDTRRPERFIAARDFDVVLLPEPERLDARARPELSWLALPFYAGQDRMHTNPPLVDWLGYGGPVLQPARRPAWNAQRGKPCFTNAATGVASTVSLPGEWPLLAAPWATPVRRVVGSAVTGAGAGAPGGG
jgi:hypothetical protein